MYCVVLLLSMSMPVAVLRGSVMLGVGIVRGGVESILR